MRDRRRRGEQRRQPDPGSQGGAGPAASAAAERTLGLTEFQPGEIPVVIGHGAELHVLFEGYSEPGVASTVSFLRDGDHRVVVDPGMVPDVDRAILDPLARLGESATSITDVVLTHHHPDHTLNAGLFPMARTHDHWATYQGDRWEDHARHVFQVSSSILMAATPGHTPQDVTVLAGTDLPDRGRLIVALTHLWWRADGPVEDPYATDPEDLHRHRRSILAIAGLIVPGHGPPFVPDARTPR